MSERFFILDGPGFLFRAYHALPFLSTSRGVPSHAVFGMSTMLWKVLREDSPDYFAVAWDPPGPTFREEKFAAYKETRSPTPSDLRSQIPYVKTLFEALHLPVLEVPGFEADDVLGTLATQERRDPVVVVSGDRDLLQLVGDEHVPVRVFYIGRGLTKATLFGPAEVAEQYGVPADRAGRAYAELALLRGDPSDGLPGVPGVGEKTAATLLARYGSLEAILAAASDSSSALPGAQRKKLLAATDYIAAAEPVVLVAHDAPVTLSNDSDALPLTARDPRRVAELAGEYGVTSSIERLQKALDKLP